MEENNFGSGSIEKELYDYIINNFEAGKTILELGSGRGTGELAKFFNMISIEHNRGWLYKYNSDYIHASLTFDGKDYWYDTDLVKVELKGKTYDLILVDGPNAHKKGIKKRRQGFFRHLYLFNTDVPIIFDDIDRKWDRENFEMTARWLKRDIRIMKSDKKQFGVIL